jgi:2-polyprenyl-3-methyl-5-hydroxy-6-metoxy-1,4-benzoquinol methylase
MSAEKFYDSFRSRLLRDMAWGNRRAEAAIKFACDTARQFQPRRILDIGCGVGWSSYECHRACPEAHITGVDFNQSLLESANVMFGEYKNISFRKTDVSDGLAHAVEGVKQDLILLLDVYEHIDRRLRSSFYKELASLLSRKSHIIMSFPSLWHQAHLRKNAPSELQPIDENVTAHDIVSLAAATDTYLMTWESRSVWNTNDYVHVLLSREPNYNRITRSGEKHKLMTKSARRSCVRKHPISKVGNELPRFHQSVALWLKDICRAWAALV